ncbi:M48 family metallopeptidase [Rarobacter incanus]|nr:M48 family metallopeptidase [Rarobacter incanus]
MELHGVTRVRIQRSTRRRRTISARIDGDELVVLMPAGLSADEEQFWVEKMAKRFQVRQRRTRPSDSELLKRARQLAAAYLPDSVRIGSVQWSDRQQRRWGSCSVETGDIRISTRLRGLPTWVLDYVLLHEMTHTLFVDHDSQFWTLLSAYPYTERARGFLQGLDFVDNGGGNDPDVTSH